jgi:hypothetical protein
VVCVLEEEGEESHSIKKDLLSAVPGLSLLPTSPLTAPVSLPSRVDFKKCQTISLQFPVPSGGFLGWKQQ